MLNNILGFRNFFEDQNFSIAYFHLRRYVHFPRQSLKDKITLSIFPS